MTWCLSTQAMRQLLLNMALPLFFFLSACPALANEPESVKVGIFVTDIYAINFADKHFTAQFWAWFNHTQPSFSPKSSIEIPGARRFQLLNIYHEERNNAIWDQAKFDATINHAWDTTYYPFDRQTLKLTVELADADAKKLRFVPDTTGSRVSSDLSLAGWQIEKVQIISNDQSYNTAYGDPELHPDGPSRYSRATLEIHMKRHGWRLLFNDFTGFFFAIILAFTSLLVNANRRTIVKIIANVKISMANGSLFASVGAAYVLQDRLPMTTSFTLADAIQLTAFGTTFISILTILIVEHILNTDTVINADSALKQQRINLALKFSRIVVFVVLLLLIADAIILVKAVTS
ncbi:MAG: hypothetical protein H7839_12305 [Magnetococcus sp. YQC-5]